MLKLYHGRTSVCSVKARLTLAEKGQSFESRLVKNIRGQVLGSEVCQAYDIARFSAYPLS